MDSMSQLGTTAGKEEGASTGEGEELVFERGRR